MYYICDYYENRLQYLVPHNKIQRTDTTPSISII